MAIRKSNITPNITTFIQWKMILGLGLCASLLCLWAQWSDSLSNLKVIIFNSGAFILAVIFIFLSYQKILLETHIRKNLLSRLHDISDFFKSQAEISFENFVLLNNEDPVSSFSKIKEIDTKSFEKMSSYSRNNTTYYALYGDIKIGQNLFYPRLSEAVYDSGGNINYVNGIIELSKISPEKIPILSKNLAAHYMDIFVTLACIASSFDLFNDVCNLKKSPAGLVIKKDYERAAHDYFKKYEINLSGFISEVMSRHGHDPKHFISSMRYLNGYYLMPSVSIINSRKNKGISFNGVWLPMYFADQLKDNLATMQADAMKKL